MRTNVDKMFFIRCHPGVLAMIMLLAGVIVGCDAADDIPVREPYAFRQPEYFPGAVYTLANNPVTPKGFELGRALFYDAILSADSSVACANCHQQAKAFSDPVHRLSRGVGEAEGFRNAPALQNLAFQNHFFWDGGVNHLDFVPINAITSDIEMKETLLKVIEKLNRSPYYTEKFSGAFGQGPADSQKMLHALSQFMCMMISDDAPYDRYMRGQHNALSDEALAGLKLFEQKCAACHSGPLFSDESFRNNGLDEANESDLGRARITEFAGDNGKFKVPSLRNVASTAPYMHDGRFSTLEKVLDHYSAGVRTSDTLDPLLKRNGVTGIALTDTEKKKLIAFLLTLTDATYLKDTRFSNPFRL